MEYTVKQLADFAGISVRTLHYYDEIGVLKPESHRDNGYRFYGEESVIRLQQVLFFRELGFSLEDIKRIMTEPAFDVLEALQSHRILLAKKAERIDELLITVDKTIVSMEGKTKMEIKEYYKGFSDEQVERYRSEARRRWGSKAIEESEKRVLKMGKEKFAELQTEGGKIFQAISDNMPAGVRSKVIQDLVAGWRQWLENFHHYPDEAALGLGKAYSQDPGFAAFFRKIHKDLPEFVTEAIEYHFRS